MRKFIEASVFSALSVVVAASVAAAVLPAHPRAAEEAPAQSAVVLAVTVSGAEEPAETTGCPYLAAIAASSACPAQPKATESTGCPFLDGKATKESPKPEKKLTGQHT